MDINIDKILVFFAGPINQTEEDKKLLTEKEQICSTITFVTLTILTGFVYAFAHLAARGIRELHTILKSKPKVQSEAQKVYSVVQDIKKTPQLVNQSSYDEVKPITKSSKVGDLKPIPPEDKVDSTPIAEIIKTSPDESRSIGLTSSSESFPKVVLFSGESEKTESSKVGDLKPTPFEDKVDSTPAKIKKKFGNKFAGLERVNQLLQKKAIEGVKTLEGVIVPLPEGLSHTQVEHFLNSNAPQVFIEWKNLAEKFESYPNKTEFLKDSTVTDCLKRIRQDIENTFLQHHQNFDTQKLPDWLKTMQQQGHHLMVRSSSIEDTAQIVNAGGNLSEAYVPPQLPEVLASCGRVVASYFGEASLKNQIQAHVNPFANPLQLSVVLQELIGESLEKNQTDIPVSLVLFTKEPLYSEKEFKVTTISCTYGHGEGVVNNEEVQTDTIYALKSRANPGDLVEIYQNHLKEERLAPIKSDQKIALQLVDNPSDLANQRSLSKEMVKRLVALGDEVEKEMGKPMDMEIVVKGDKIYIVQMREIKRPPATPTYLSDKAIQTLTTSPILATEYTKVLVPGKLDVQEIHSSKEILICKTLKEAESQFIAGMHKCVIVSTDEPSNSHPVINFSGMGVPCFYTEQMSQEFIQNMNKETSLVACPQSGRLCLWNKEIVQPKQCIESGYFSHPAYMNLSLGHDSSISSQDAIEVPKEIQEALLALKTAQEQNVALQALNQLKQLPALTELKGKISKLEKDLKTVDTPQAKERIKLLKKLDKRVQKTFAEIEASYQHQAPRLEKLFHIKTLSTLLADSSSSNSFSLLQAPSLIQGIEKSIEYQKKLSSPAKFVNLLHIGDKALSEENSKKWEDFLLELEGLTLSEDSIKEFQDLMTVIHKNESVPMWLNLIFLPLLEERNPSKEVLESLVTESQQQVSIINDLNHKLKAMEGIKPSLFSNPKTFDEAWKKLYPIMQDFSSPDIQKNLLSSSKLVCLLVNGSMKKYADLVDESIKAIKSSPDFSDQEKLNKINSLLKGNYGVLKAWSEVAEQKSHIPLKEGDLSGYFNFIETAWKKCELTLTNPANLKPSTGFSVLAATMGSSTLLKRHTPETLEDIFTLIHQNQLFILSHLNSSLITDPLLNQLKLPKLFEDTMKKIGKIDYHLSNRTGVNITEKGITITYNLPLNNHSACFELEWNKSSGAMMMHVKFFGERGQDRWKAISDIVQVLNEAGIIKAEKIAAYTSQEFQYSWEIKEETLATTIQALSCFTSIADGGNGIVDQTENFSNSLHSDNVKKLVQVLCDRTEKNVNLLSTYKSLAWLLKPHETNPIIMQRIEKMKTEYGKSDDVNILHKEIDHLISFITKIENLLPDLKAFDQVVPRYFTKNISAKKGAKLLLASQFKIEKKAFISLSSQLIKNQISRYKEGGLREIKKEKDIITLFGRVIGRSSPSEKLQLLDDAEALVRKLTPENDFLTFKLVEFLMDYGRCFDLIPQWIETTKQKQKEDFQNKFELAKRKWSK